ncbi:hypothetical protein [Salinimicrobium xinjiangense]|uniref:hypothetical protein n=1 Tax=Salinimicrobium xinjiangense TaxID=438596 RepID=UPI00041D7C3F|nr:hypothetical protein [Salinimicrobium xinjiangense]
MKEKKYIDRLYQEKFREFEAAPRDAVWKSIAEKLQQEEQRRPVIAPLWPRLAGVAAILAFLLLIGEWILPVQRGTSIVNQDSERTTTPPSVSPANTRLTIVPSEVGQKSEISISLSTNSISQISEEERTPVKIASLETGVKNVIFDTPSPIAGTNLQKEATSTTPEAGKKSLLDVIAENEEVEIAATSPKTKFEVSTHAAPIYYGNLGRGNFLDQRFNNNSSEGEITYSYGINLAYNLSDKIKIRSGVNKVNMSYNTGGVAYQAVAGVSGAAPLKNVSLESGTTVTNGAGDKMSGRQPTGGTLRNPAGFLTRGNLNQKMGFIEVPLELEYNLFAHKFELNLIGGASTLFLDENQVSLESTGISAEGRANNINSVSFSTNIGFGLDYNLSNKFKLNLEPMLKYQLNTFDSSTENAKPYYIGVYSGFSYKF